MCTYFIWFASKVLFAAFVTHKAKRLLVERSLSRRKTLKNREKYLSSRYREREHLVSQSPLGREDILSRSVREDRIRSWSHKYGERKKQFNHFCGSAGEMRVEWQFIRHQLLLEIVPILLQHLPQPSSFQRTCFLPTYLLMILFLSGSKNDLRSPVKRNTLIILPPKVVVQSHKPKSHLIYIRQQVQHEIGNRREKHCGIILSCRQILLSDFNKGVVK